MLTNRRNTPLTITFGLVVATAAAFAWAQQADEMVLFEQPVNHDVYAASRDIDVRSTIDGDLVAAGARVKVGGNVSGDVIAAAQDIEISSDVNDDVRAVGQRVRILSPVSGHVVAAGQSVTVAEQVGDWAWLAGDKVEVLDRVGGNLSIRANEIIIDAEVGGNVEVVGENLRLDPNTKIRGDLTWRSNSEAVISPEAQIDGEFIQEARPGLLEELTTQGGYSLPLSSIIAVSALFLLFSRPLRATAERIGTSPGKSLLFGALVFLATPTLVVVLWFTGIGFWLGFSVLLIYFVILLLGILTGLFAVSDLALRYFREQPVAWQSLAAIFVTVVAVMLLAKVPWLGSLLLMGILLIGICAFCWNSWSNLRSSGQSSAQAP
ncbi:MAG: hypothetical protein KJO82_14045 [Gammaproteobacteria bacterium]|nr:hypothetical protein [Gammaproteobacteria bacterium]